MPQSVDLSDLAQPPNSDPKRLKDVLAGVIPGARPTSEQRSPAHNRQVGGVADSRHLTGDAIDFNPPAGMTRAQAVAAIRKADPHAAELLDEGTHIHWAPGIKHVDLSDISAGHVDLSDLAAPKPASAAKPARQPQPAPAAQPAASRPNMVSDAIQRTQRLAHESLEDLRATARQKPSLADAMPFFGITPRGVREAGDLIGVGLSPVGGAGEAITRNDPVLNAALRNSANDPLLRMAGRKPPTPEQAARGSGAFAEAAAPIPPITKLLRGAPELRVGEELGTEGAGRVIGAKPTGYDPNLPRGEAATRQQLAGAAKVARDSARIISRVISPETTEHGRPAAQIVRRTAASHALSAAKAEDQLGRVARITAPMKDPDRLALIDHIEHRSDPGRLIPAAQKPVVDTIGKTMDHYRNRIEYVMGKTDEGGPSFIKDYYSHLWQQKPEEVEKAYQGWVGRQGSGRSLKRRTIPTIQDGIEMGLTPVTTDPVEATSLYAQNMSRFLATHDVLNQFRESGIAKFYIPGQEPEGWKPLTGIGTTRKGVLTNEAELRAQGFGSNQGPDASDLIKPDVTPQRQLFAPRDAAAVYNSWAGKGIEGTPVRAAYQGLRTGINSVTMLKLGLSTYHAATETMEAMHSATARALTELSRIPGTAARGDLGRASLAAKNAVKGLASAPVAVVKSALRGNRLQREVLGLQAADGLSAKVNTAWERAGGRIRMDPLYRAKASGSFWQALKRGTLKTAVMDAAKKVYTGSAWERAKGVLDLTTNLIQSTAEPLFEELIPRVKAGVFAENMQDWLKHFPDASQEEQDRMAIKLVDSIDNRMGEMIQDHIFWDRALKQALQTTMLSPSWNIGTVREIGGGLWDIPASVKGIATGRGITPRTAYTAAMAVNLGTIGAVATYLLTGKGPQSMEDLEAPKTGGTVETGSGRYTQDYPERLSIPGNQKDVFAFVRALSEGSPGLITEAAGKEQPGLTGAGHILANADWRGDPEYVPPGVPSQPGDPTLAGALGREFGEPITLEMVGERKRGTGIPLWATVLGARPSPEYVAAPDIYKEQRVARERKRLDQRAKHEETARERAAQ